LLVLYFLWQAIYKNSPESLINGMDFKSMITYLIYARVASALVFASSSFWIIGEDIYEGNIAINLIRPIHYRYRLLFTSLGNFISAFILMFLPLMIISTILLYTTLGVEIPSVYAILIFLISALLSFVIADSLNF